MNNMWGWSFKSKPSPLLVQGWVLLETTWKKTGPKRYGRAPILLVLLRGGLGSPATCYFQKQSHSSFMSLITRCSMICTVSPIDLVFIYFTPGWKRSSSSTGQGPGSQHQTSHGYSQGGLDDIKSCILCDKVFDTLFYIHFHMLSRSQTLCICIIIFILLF